MNLVFTLLSVIFVGCGFSQDIENDRLADETGFTYLKEHKLNSTFENRLLNQMDFLRNRTDNSSMFDTSFENFTSTNSLILNPPPVEIDSWARLRQFASIPVTPKSSFKENITDMPNGDGESFLASVGEEFGNISAFNDIQNLKDKKSQGRFGCMGGDVCETCSAFAILPDGYPVCCIFCLVHPTIQPVSDVEFSCTCEYF